MSSDKKWKRPAKLDLNSVYKQTKGRERPRSTMFEDEIGKSERRSNRRMSDKRLIDDTLEEESEALLPENEWEGLEEYLDRLSDF